MADGKKLVYLESVRGLAAVVVVIHHLVLAFRPEWAADNSVHTPLAFLYNGAFAVHVFFVLSGFVLSYSFFKTRRIDAIAGPAIRRYFRLAIPSGISIVAAYLLLRNGLFLNVEAGHLTGSKWFAHWYKFTPAFFGFDPDAAVYQSLYGIFRGQSFEYNNVLWTMQVELLGSFMVYATLAVFGSVRHRSVIYTVIFILLSMTEQLNYVGFVIGMAACDWVTSRERSVDLGRFGWLILAVGLTAGAYSGLVSTDFRPVIAAALLIAAPLLSSSVRRPLESTVLSFVGKISFGLYLTHVLVLASLGSWVFLHLVRIDQWPLHTAAVVAGTIVMIVSLAAGWVMHHLSDRPSIAIGRWVSDWFLSKETVRLPLPSQPRLRLDRAA